MTPPVDPAVRDSWQFSTPTGIAEGYDASDPSGFRPPPTQAEIDASVATTIYSLWRSRALAAIVDGPLDRLQSRRLPAGRRSGDVRAPAPAGDGRHRGLRDRLLRRARRT
jgi:hypothetical protein